MIGLDTNILVRYLTQDDPVQTEKVNQLIEKQLTPEQPGHITVITLVELVWVLESCYGQAKDAITRMLRELLDTRQLVMENLGAVVQAIGLYLSGRAGFSDALIVILARQAGCSAVVTFDKQASSVGMVLL